MMNQHTPASKEEWDRAAEGLVRLERSESFAHELIMIQPVGPEYFTDDSVQYCILERPDKTRYCAPY